MVIYKKFINIEKLDFATFTPMLNIELQRSVRNMREKIILYIYIIYKVFRPRMALYWH